MTSLAWGPVGHCTSGRPLNPPLNISFNGAVFTAARHTSIYSQHRANVIPTNQNQFLLIY